MSKEFERIFPKILKKPGLFQISFEKARKSPAKKPGLFWAGLFTLTNPDLFRTFLTATRIMWGFRASWVDLGAGWDGLIASWEGLGAGWEF